MHAAPVSSSSTLWPIEQTARARVLLLLQDLAALTFGRDLYDLRLHSAQARVVRHYLE
jgi:hypothetical protein